MKVILLGVGSGAEETLTLRAKKVLGDSRVIIGAPRLLAALPTGYGARRISAVALEDILARLRELRDSLAPGSQAAVVLSGDSGFYSGARRLLPILGGMGYETELLPGLSSVQMFAARLERPWQDWRLVSAHGVECDAVAEVMRGQPVFFLTGGASDPGTLCAALAEAGLDTLSVAVGENLFLPDETVIRGTAGEMAGRTFAPLSVLLAEPAPSMPRHTPGWPDGWFVRGQVPMTKQLVRAAALAKLAVSPRDVCWDVGAGTGSVSVELAACARRVYAVECMPEACGLIRQNRVRHNAWNLTLKEGRAPNALEELPAPDAVFVGGSRGELPAIVNLVLTKNPSARLCIAAVTLETIQAAMSVLDARGIEAEVTQMAVSRSRAAGRLHMLAAGNPVFLITGNCQ